MKYRTLEDGRRIYPKRGDPPAIVPEGYSRDPKDPWSFVLDVPDCEHRKLIRVPLPGCSCVAVKLNCQLFKKGVSNLDCWLCEESEEP